MVTTLTPLLECELDDLIEAVDARTPANPRSPKNRRKALELERLIKRYFTSLENALSDEMVEQLYYKYVAQEAIGHGAWDGIHSTLDPILATFRADFAAWLANQTASTYVSGVAEMTTWGHTLGGIPIAYEGPPVQKAIDYAEKHCAQLVTKMNEETKRRLAKVISNGIEGKRGVPGLARDIKSEFADMRRYRSIMISRTETANALSQASLDSMKDMGIDGKESVPAGDPCEICQANAADGVIPVGQAFSSGDMAPPFHPNCECALAPARLPVTKRK